MVTRALTGPVTQSLAVTWTMPGAEAVGAAAGVGVKTGVGNVTGRVGRTVAKAAAGTVAEATSRGAGSAVGVGGGRAFDPAAGWQAASKRTLANSQIKPRFIKESCIGGEL